MTVVDDIKGRLDILEVVSHYIPLQRSGRSYKANCPFHQERTPSFYVFPERQTWRCFGACADGGDVFSFVMRAENLEFTEALRRMAQHAGVTLPTRERRTDQQITLQINEASGNYFRQFLDAPSGVEARRYLEQRGLTAQTIEKFELGLSPWDGASLRSHLLQRGFSLEELARAGVTRIEENGQHRDFFRGRLMIPIRDAQGELVGFGGRVLPGYDSHPKYLNSPRSPAFDKARVLYGLYLTKQASKSQGIVVVEGYMDAIMAHQYGFDNVVASMGTALTVQQVSQIRKLTGNVTLALDPDAAGQQATLRSLESSWQVFQSQVAGRSRGTILYQRQETRDLKIAVMPDGMDPDEVIRRSPEEWSRLVTEATPLVEYVYRMLSAQADLSSPQGKAWLAESMFPLIAAISEPAQQDHYFQSLAVLLGVSEETLKASMARPNAGRRSRGAAPAVTRATPSAFAKQDHDPMEEYCLALLLQYPELRIDAEELRLEFFHRIENREIFSHWQRLSSDIQASGAPGALRRTVDADLLGQLESLATKSLPPTERSRCAWIFQDGVRRLEERHLRELKAEEELRFSELPVDSLVESDELYMDALDVNERIRHNEGKRNASARRGLGGR